MLPYKLQHASFELLGDVLAYDSDIEFVSGTSGLNLALVRSRDYRVTTLSRMS